MNGEGVPIDNVKAYIWFDIPAGKGLVSAKHYRDVISKIMSPGQISQAKRLANQ